VSIGRIKNPESALARKLARLLDADIVEEVVSEQMRDELEPTPEESEAAVLAWLRAQALDDDESMDLLVRIGWASLDRDALDAELARRVAKTIRRGLAQLRADLRRPAPPARSELDPRRRLAADSQALLASLRELERREPGALHSVARAWRPSVHGVPKDRFDRAAVHLARTGQIILHHHDYPAELSVADREGLIRDDAGTYYVGVGLPAA
jgi:hypothetical protein